MRNGEPLPSSAVALEVFYASLRVCYVKATLRGFNKWSQFPEEINRQLTGKLRINGLYLPPNNPKGIMREEEA